MEQWFVLNHIPRDTSPRSTARYAVDSFNRNGARLELFAPTFVRMEEVKGKVQVRNVPLTFHYVFVRGTLDDVRQLCSLSNGFSLVLSHGSTDRYLVVPDARMADFMIIARAYQNCLPCYDIDDIDLDEGDLVQVIDGPFAGLQGSFIPRKKSSSGNIVLSVTQNIGTIVYNVSTRYVRVLKFSTKSRRAYDQIEAFLPRLYEALRVYRANGTFSPSQISVLSTFCQRFGELRLDNGKLDAKLQAFLLCAATLLSNINLAKKVAARLERRRSVVTNPWTAALIDFLAAATSNDTRSLQSISERLSSLSPTSRSQEALITELSHHLISNRQ